MFDQMLTLYEELKQRKIEDNIDRFLEWNRAFVKQN